LKIAGVILQATNKQIGVCLGWIFLIVTVLIVYDVVARYLFDSSTGWIVNFSTYACGIVSVIGGGYVLLIEGHVRTDVFSSRFKPRTLAIVNAFLFVFFLIFMLSLLFTGWDLFWTALEKGRSLAGTTKWPLWPYLLAIPIGALLFLLQGVADFVKNINIAYRGTKGVNEQL